MPGLESALPEAFQRAVADGTLRAGLMLARDQDAFGQPLEAMLEQVFTTAEEIVAATDEMKADFRIDGVYGEEDEQDVRLALPGYTADLKDFTGVICFAAGPGGEPFCLDFRADAARPSVLYWDEVYWRRIAPDIAAFLALWNTGRGAANE